MAKRFEEIHGGGDVRRITRLYRVFVRNSIARELEFRANFWAKIGQNFIWMLFFLLIVEIVFSKTDGVAGYSKAESYVLLATGYLLHAIIGAFFGPNLQEIPMHVRMGTLDYVLVKPVDSQFWVSARRMNFDALGVVPMALGLIMYAFTIMHTTPTALGVIAYIALMACALAIFYGLQLMLMTLAIWFVRVDNLWVLGDTLFDLARWPMSIYDPRTRFFLTYVFPLAFTATVPGNALLGTKDFNTGYFMMALGWAAAFLLVSRWFWRFALRFYSSASS